MPHSHPFPAFCASFENYQAWIDQQTKALEVPPASAEAIATSYKLSRQICQKIKQQDGALAFSQFMKMALYQPSLGYYSAGSRKFGQAGDFVTAPEISSLFGRSISNQIAQVFETQSKQVLEIGAGSGKLMCDILLELEAQDRLPDNYFILEVSADLQQRQKVQLLKKAPQLVNRVRWLDKLPENFKGVILANEVLDALPTDLLKKEHEQCLKAAVVCQDKGFAFQWETDFVKPQIEGAYKKWPAGYTTEFNHTIEPWLTSLSDCLAQGLILLIDYGYSRQELYQVERSQGSLQCYYRHHKHFNPLLLLGLQDITSSVDFSLVAESGVKSGLDLQGYTTQMMFLIGCGIEDYIAGVKESDTMSSLKLGQELRALMMPDQMGETCKAIAFCKGYSDRLRGFSVQNDRHKLDN